MKTRILFTAFILFILPYIYSQELTPSEIFSKAAPSVVKIISYNSDSSICSIGSGVAVGDSGYLYTNWHILEESFFIVVKKDDVELTGVLVAGIDADRDIAILKIPAGLIHGLSIGNSDSVRTGDLVYALGNPRGYTNTFSQGIISSLRAGYSTMIQYTASTSHGSSGGALLNSRGELIGITSSTVEDAQNINFAIPSGYYQSTFTADLNDSDGKSLMQDAVEIFNSHSNRSALYMDSIIICYNENNPLTTPGARFFSQLFLKIGYYHRAMDFIDTAIMQKPYDANLHVLKARLFDLVKEPDKAIDRYGVALELDSINYNALYNRAILLKYQKSDYAGSIRDLLTITNSYPLLENLYIDIADSYLKSGDTAKALISINNSYFAKIEDTRDLDFRASLLTSMGKYYEAIFDYDYAIAKDPMDKSFYFKRGIAYLKLDMPDIAASDFQKCISLDARNAESYNNLAYCYYNLHDFESAENNFEKALTLDPKHFDSYIGLSITSLEQNKIKKCLQSMSKALQLRHVLKSGMKGIEKISEEGYFWQAKELKGIRKVYTLMHLEEPDEPDYGDDSPQNATVGFRQISK